MTPESDHEIQGDFLIDVTRNEKRFRIKSLLVEGKSYQIALAEDVLLDNKLVCIKAIAYDHARTDDKKYVGQRRKALHNELKLLAEPFHLLPDPLDWIQLSESQTSLSREPVLVYEYVHGDTLYDYVREKFPEGMNPNRALRIASEIAEFLADLHTREFVFRDLDPRHIVISLDDVIHLVGFGNVTAIGESINSAKPDPNPAYTAPEIRDDLSGKLLRPAVDAYALGALLSFMLTGEEPRSSTENPLTREAYQKLSSLEQKGVALLIARCMRPMAKERVARMERLIPFLDPQNLPTPTMKGFGLIALPAPWQGAEQENRATASKISAGPLISVKPENGAQTAEPKKEIQKSKPKGCRALLAPFITVSIVLSTVVAALLF